MVHDVKPTMVDRPDGQSKYPSSKLKVEVRIKDTDYFKEIIEMITGLLNEDISKEIRDRYLDNLTGLMTKYDDDNEYSIK